LSFPRLDLVQKSMVRLGVNGLNFFIGAPAVK
jgi:hypothetical protein